MSASPLIWDDEGLPRSALYGDVYYSAEDGLAETRAVFLAGCGLPDAWAGRKHFTVGELGFGTGLNIAALLTLWRETKPEGARLHIFSAEAHPVTRAEAERALARWPEIGAAANALTRRWPGQARGVHRLDLPEFAATLDVAVMEAGEALAGWDGAADAWFLDGFSPASNPQMWREELLARVAARSAPGARAATFTVAGVVRRGLEAAGFATGKRPGFGRKRERLEARLPGVPAERPQPRVAIVGAGIAGASLARAFAAQGIEPVMFGADEGASRNPAALVTPRLDAGLARPARLYSESFRRAVALYGETGDAVIAHGARQLETTDRDAGRFAKIAASGLFEPGTMTPEAGALVMTGALTVDPACILDAWSPAPAAARIERLERAEDAWRIHADGEVHEAEIVCLAAGHASAAFAPLPLQAIRGQASWADGLGIEAAAFGGYAIPTRTGVLFGATHDRDVDDTAVREEDHARNLALLAKGLPELARALADKPLQARASVRAATPDKLPLAGAVAGQDGLWVLSGLGSRGFCTAPLLGEHIAARVLGLPSPLAADLAALTDPARYAGPKSPRQSADLPPSRR